jgi:hypothetical protein
MSDAERFSRQERLAEVGQEGQRKIAGSTAEIGGEGAEVERAYLAGAGVGRLVARAATAEPFAHAAMFEFDAPREVGAGAWRALRHLRGVLGVGAR